MPAKRLPWPTIITSSEEKVGRLIRTEVRKVFQERKAIREAQAARARTQARRAGTGRDQ
jgi:hypothetical protein